jgi:hypothetical protein
LRAKVSGAIQRQVSQSMHEESTKTGPATFSGRRSSVRAMPAQPAGGGKTNGHGQARPRGADLKGGDGGPPP